MAREKLHDILKKEVELFRSLLDFSKKFAGEIDQLSLNIISEMLNLRQEWIDKIQKLETDRAKLKEEKLSPEMEAYLQEISALAKNLVEIDNLIYRHLEEEKLRIVKEMSGAAAGKNYRNREVQSGDGKSNFLDITQE